jgi:ankyrin repeat protein
MEKNMDNGLTPPPAALNDVPEEKSAPIAQDIREHQKVLMTAIYFGNDEKFERALGLLENINFVDQEIGSNAVYRNFTIHENGFTPLDFAISRNKSGMVSKLINKGAQLIRHKDGENDLKTPSLNLAAKKGGPVALKYILTLIKDFTPEELGLALREASDSNKSLLQIHINAQLIADRKKGNNIEGWLKLDCIYDWLRLDVTNASSSMIDDEKVAEEKSRSDLNLVLQHAIEYGYKEVAAELVAKKVDVNWRKSNQDKTPLIQAACRMELDIMGLLLDAGADPNANVLVSDFNADQEKLIEKYRYNLVQLVVLAMWYEIIAIPTKVEERQYQDEEYIAMVERLIALGLKPNNKFVVSIRGETLYPALYYAAEIGNIKLVKMLLQHCDCINLCDEEQNTPLFNAVNRGHIAIVELLLAHGAKIQIKDPYKLQPSPDKNAIQVLADSNHYATSEDKARCEKLLRDWATGKPQIFTFTLGLHARAGADSSIRRAWTRGFGERHVLGIIEEMLDGTHTPNEPPTPIASDPAAVRAQTPGAVVEEVVPHH